MVFVNKDSINQTIANIGEDITITHYTADQAYDSDQNPTRTSETIKTKAHATMPNKYDIEMSGGSITIDDFKFVMGGDISVDVSDQIMIDRTSRSFSVKRIDPTIIAGKITKKKVFASRVD